MKDKQVSIKDVAKRAGVSISTVSNAIRGTKFVSSELKEKVFDAVNELHYQVNPVASSLKSRTTRTIGVIIPNINRIFFPQVIKGIQDLCIDDGLNVTLCDSNDSLEKEKHFIHMLQGNWADGIIIDTVAEETDTDYLQRLAALSSGRKRIPVISLERQFDCCAMDSVKVDNYLAAQKATGHLIECGCKQIVHITGPRYSCMAKERLQGYRETISAELKREPMIINGDFSPLSGYEAVKSFLKVKRQFDGIFAANDQMAVGAIKALREYGLRIPEDVKIVGFDNTFVASLVHPSLTTIHVPKYEMGTNAADLLFKRIEQPDSEPVHVELPVKLIPRRSTGADVIEDMELFGW